jgi:hypothetical protein
MSRAAAMMRRGTSRPRLPANQYVVVTAAVQDRRWVERRPAGFVSMMQCVLTRPARPTDVARDQSGIAAPGLADATTDKFFSVRCPQ